MYRKLRFRMGVFFVFSIFGGEKTATYIGEVNLRSLRLDLNGQELWVSSSGLDWVSELPKGWTPSSFSDAKLRRKNTTKRPMPLEG